MTGTNERREVFRRYGDRRRALMLSIHEILFDQLPGEARDHNLLDEICGDFCTDGAVLVRKLTEKGTPDSVTLLASAGDWDGVQSGDIFEGEGIEALLSAQEDAQGAVALSRFRRTSLINDNAWEQLWQNDLGKPATGLLSVDLKPSEASPSLIWLILNGASREWSSHDRQLLEEAADLLSRAADKVVQEDSK